MKQKRYRKLVWAVLARYHEWVCNNYPDLDTYTGLNLMDTRDTRIIIAKGGKSHLISVRDRYKPQKYNEYDPFGASYEEVWNSLWYFEGAETYDICKEIRGENNNGRTG